MKSQPSRRRDFAALEKRRLQAAALFAQGQSRSQVMRALGVSWQAADNWFQAWRKSGEAGLKAAGRAGRKPRLNAAQLKRVERELLRGPVAHGYSTELWTLPRIADLIARITEVRYHSGHVWKILRRLGWSLQRPEHQAKERDEEAIRRWLKRRWPQRKRGR
jgi:transposase